MDPFQCQNPENKKDVYAKYTCSLNFYDSTVREKILVWGAGFGARQGTDRFSPSSSYIVNWVLEIMFIF